MCFRYWESGLNVLAQIKHKDRKCGVSEGRGVSYIVYGKGLTHKHIMLWLRPVALTFFLKERGKAAFNLNCSLLSTAVKMYTLSAWQHCNRIKCFDRVGAQDKKRSRRKCHACMMHDALPHHSEARRMWLIKMFLLNTVTVNISPIAHCQLQLTLPISNSRQAITITCRERERGI